MNENNNPYVNPEPSAPRPPQNVQPQPGQWAQPQQQPRQWAQPQPQQWAQPQPQPQPVKTVAEAQQDNGAGAAMVFGVVSLIIGFAAVMLASMYIFNFRYTIDERFNKLLTWPCLMAIASLIFGVVSALKKPEKKFLTIIGIVLAALVLFATYIMYFFVVNKAP